MVDRCVEQTFRLGGLPGEHVRREVRKRSAELALILGDLGVTRDKLLENVWGFAYPGETRTVDVHVKQLRDKLSGANAKIETVWGVGYKLVAPA